MGKYQVEQQQVELSRQRLGEAIIPASRLGHVIPRKAQRIGDSRRIARSSSMVNILRFSIIGFHPRKRFRSARFRSTSHSKPEVQRDMNRWSRWNELMGRNIPFILIV
jgi:hypothetical protein